MVQQNSLAHRYDAIRTRDLSKAYEDGASRVLALEELNLHVKRGEVFGFLGPNGAGKSTTINLLLGLTEPTAGAADILGHDAHGEAVSLRERIGVLPEGLGLYERLTGRRHLEFACAWKDADDDPDDLFARVGLEYDEAERPVGEYSKGMRQRLALAMALVGSPELLILDEPSSGLDPHGIRRLREIVREERDRGATVFFSSHILDQVEAVCDRVGILADGNLVDVDTVEGLRRTVGSGTELQLRIEGPLDTDISGIDGVGDVTLADGILRVHTHDPTAKARVVERVSRDGTTVLDIDSTKASLEDVFTAYTRTDDGDPSVRANGRRTEVRAR